MSTSRVESSDRTSRKPRPGVRVGVLVFPGSNDDRDMANGLARLGGEVEMVWHKDTRLPEGLGGIAVPGGFSYGDYLRAGAMARFSPVMRAVEERARAGAAVLGVCNGFQILCEAGLLPGALVRNRELRFVCKFVAVRVADPGGFSAELEAGRDLEIPIKHVQGAYVPDPAHPPRVAFRYRSPNPNGSVDDIAGVLSDEGNVLGLMPHPEHAVDPLLGSTDGAPVLRSFLALAAGATA